MHNAKLKGESGDPCLVPLVVINGVGKKPFVNTAKEQVYNEEIK